MQKTILGNVLYATRLSVQYIHEDYNQINVYREANHNRLGRR
jgi:hypothetical protein